MKKGWISLHRQIQDCVIWIDEEPFDRRSAWVDILLSANHEDKEILFDGHRIIVKRGQFLTSVRRLSERWKWSKDRTLRYLRLLEELGMIERESNARRTLLTIVKYEDYQSQQDTDKDTDKDSREDTHKDSHKDTDTPQTIMNNNENNVNNENNNIPRSVKHKYGEYNHVLLTDSERDKLFAEYGTSESLEAISFLDEYIEMKGYKAKNHYLCIKKWVFDALKRQNGQTRTSKPQERDLIQELMNA